MFKFVPPNQGRDLPKPSRGVIVAYVQPIVPYFRPFKRPLNYFEYKKKRCSCTSIQSRYQS